MHIIVSNVCVFVYIYWMWFILKASIGDSVGSKEAKEEENAKAFPTGTDTPVPNLFGWN